MLYTIESMVFVMANMQCWERKNLEPILRY